MIEREIVKMKNRVEICKICFYYTTTYQEWPCNVCRTICTGESARTEFHKIPVSETPIYVQESTIGGE